MKQCNINNSKFLPKICFDCQLFLCLPRIFADALPEILLQTQIPDLHLSQIAKLMTDPFASLAPILPRPHIDQNDIVRVQKK